MDQRTTFRPPDAASRLPVAQRHASERIERDCDRWARPYLVDHFGGARAEDAADRFLRRRGPLWACLCYPHTLADRGFALPNLMTPTALAESLLRPPIGPPPSRLRDRFLAVLDGDRPAPGFAAGRMLHEALEPVLAQMAPGVAGRLLTAYHGLLGRPPGRAGGLWATVLTEYALGLDLTDELAAEPALARARDLAVEHLLRVRELYEPRGETRTRLESGAAARAVRETEDSFAECCGEVLGGPLGAHPGMRRYVPELGHLISGNLHFRRQIAGQAHSPSANAGRA